MVGLILLLLLLGLLLLTLLRHLLWLLLLRLLLLSLLLSLGHWLGWRGGDGRVVGMGEGVGVCGRCISGPWRDGSGECGEGGAEAAWRGRLGLNARVSVLAMGSGDCGADRE